jgi:hypothetical protein
MSEFLICAVQRAICYFVGLDPIGQMLIMFAIYIAWEMGKLYLLYWSYKKLFGPGENEAVSLPETQVKSPPDNLSDKVRSQCPIFLTALRNGKLVTLSDSMMSVKSLPSKAISAATLLPNGH